MTNDICRFKHYIQKKNLLWGVEFRAENPVPIYNDSDKLIGFASVSDELKSGLIQAAIDPATPERLDLETNAKPYWLSYYFEYRGNTWSTIVYVRRIILTGSKLYGEEAVSLVEL
jgi:hypothetical protein